MATQTIPRLTEAEYLALDRANPYRSEYIGGEMFAMAGGTLRHTALAARCIVELNSRLAGRGCTVFSSDARVRTPRTASHVYPHVSVVCGEVRTQPNASDVLINPAIVVEVLSPTTRDYDKGAKFELYREIDSLTDYLLVDSDDPKVVLYSRQPDNSWILREVSGLQTSIAIPSLSITIDLPQIYGDLMNLLPA
jgi:Uma2 family endonuclease